MDPLAETSYLGDRLDCTPKLKHAATRLIGDTSARFVVSVGKTLALQHQSAAFKAGGKLMFCVRARL